MSSNLMTMKFMQRAAASQSQKSSPGAPPTPGSSEPPSKRMKTDTRTPDYGRAEAMAGSLAAPMLSDLQRMEIATAEEEAKRERALEKLAAEAGETKWVLDTTQGKIDDEKGGPRALRVARAGYGDIDEGEGGAIVRLGGRRSFGRYNNEIEKVQSDTNGHSSQMGPYSESSSGDGASGEDGEVEDAENDYNRDLAGPQELIEAGKREMAQRVKAERKAKQEAEKHEMASLAEKRKTKDVRLSRLSSISGGGGGGGGASGRDTSKIKCFQCGKKGHERRDCPQKAKRGQDTGSRKRKMAKDSLDY